MKKKIIISIVCIIILLCCIFGFLAYKNKPTQINLTQTQITESTEKVNSLMSVINSTNFNKFKNMSISKLQNEKDFNEIVKSINGNLGQYKSAIFEKALLYKGNDILIYSASFSKKTPVELTITLDKGKIAGIFYN